MINGIECWESHECNKPGQLREDCTVCKKRIAERGNKPKRKRVETTAVVQEVIVETLVYDDGILIQSRFGFMCLSRQREAQHLHRFRFLDLQLNSVGTRKYTGQNVDSIRWSSRVGWFLS